MTPPMSGADCSPPPPATPTRTARAFTRAPGLLRRLLDMEWLVVGAAAPLLTFPTVRPRWTAAALAVLAVWWLLRWAVRREPWPVTPFNGALLLFALMIPVGVWASAVPELTIPKATGLVLGLAVLRALVLVVRSRRHLGLAVALFCLVGLGILIVGVLGAGWSAKVGPLYVWTRHIPRLIRELPESQADAVSPNQLAGALTLYLPLALALLFGWRFSRRAIAGPLLGLIGCFLFLVPVAGTLLITQSRSGWIGGMVGILALVTLALLTAPRRWERILGMALPLLTAGVVAALVLRIGPERVGELLNGGEVGTLEEAVGTINMAGRVEIWSRALYAIQDFPFTGCGLGAFRRVVWVLYPLFTISPDTDISHAHNIFLQTALDLGILGLVAYLALLEIALALCWRAALTPTPAASGGFSLPLSRAAEEGGRGEGVRALALGLAGGLIALHAYGMTDALALGSKPAIVFWFALGLTAALENIRTHAER